MAGRFKHCLHRLRKGRYHRMEPCGCALLFQKRYDAAKHISPQWQEKIDTCSRLAHKARATQETFMHTAGICRHFP
jgi:hypothetical protein